MNARRWIAVIGAVATPVVGIAVAAIVNHALGVKKVDAEIGRIRAAGDPVDAADLETLYARPPAAQDATATWLRAVEPLDTTEYYAEAEDLPIVGMEQKPAPGRGQPWDLTDVEALLARHQPSLDGLREAAALGGAARYQVDFHLGQAALLPHLGGVRQGMRLLLLEASVRHHRGDGAGAAESLHVAHVLVESLADEPHLVSQLVRIACQETVIDALRRMIADGGFSDADLAALQADLRSLNYDEGLLRSMLAERVLLLAFFLDPLGAEDVDDFGALRHMWWVYGGDNTAHYLTEYATPCVDCARLPWPARWMAIEELAAGTETAVDGSDRSTKIAATMAALHAPALRSGFAAVGHSTAMARASDVALGVERHRQQHGRLPASLDEIAPELLPAVPLDPFDGEPLRYERTDTGYRIYGTTFGDSPAETRSYSGGAFPAVDFRVEPPTAESTEQPAAPTEGA